MTAANPTLPKRALPAPDRTILLILFFVVTSFVLLISHNAPLLESLGPLGTLLKNPIVEAVVVSVFLANILFAYLWNAKPWAKLLVGLSSLLLVLPMAGREDTSLLDLSISIMIFAALALGLNIVVGLAGLLDLGYVAFFAVGAYAWGVFGSPRIAEILHYYGENPGATALVTLGLGGLMMIVGAAVWGYLRRAKRSVLEGWAGIGQGLGALVLTLAVVHLMRLGFAGSDKPWSPNVYALTAVVLGVPLLVLLSQQVRGLKIADGVRTLLNTVAGAMVVLGLGLIIRSIVLFNVGAADGLQQGVAQGYFWLFLVLSIIAAALVGVLIGLPVLKLKGDYLAIITLGLGEVIRVLANNLELYTAGSQGITPIKSASVPWFDRLAGTLGFSPDQYNLLFLYLLVLVMIVVILTVNIRLDRSRIGRAWIAIRDDEVAAQAMGVPLMQTKLIAFATGASFAGVMGMIFAAKQTFISPESFVLNQSIMVLAMVILGGMGSFPGVILGAAVVTLLNLRILPGLGEASANVSWIPQQVNPGQLQRLVFGVILVAIMLLRPEGLLPNKRRVLELHHDDPQEDDSAHGNAGALGAGNSGDVYSPGIAPIKENDRSGGAK